jgi:hypothetical protein
MLIVNIYQLFLNIKEMVMKYTLVLFITAIIFLVMPLSIPQPDYNGTDPGCTGNGCHTFQDGIVSAAASGMEVTVTLTGTTSSVAGELVDSSGTVVAVNNSTSNNPFVLTAPGPGRYLVNAGYKNPSRRWDSAAVVINVTGVANDPSELNSFKLYNNYPNPFNPSTTIKFSLPEASFTTLKIYNALGKEIAVLVNEMISSGTHSVVFDAHNLPSGVYFYSLESSSLSQVKKMLLIK